MGANEKHELAAAGSRLLLTAGVPENGLVGSHSGTGKACSLGPTDFAPRGNGSAGLARWGGCGSQGFQLTARSI